MENPDLLAGIPGVIIGLIGLFVALSLFAVPAEEPSVTASGDSGPSRWLVAILAACAAAAGLVVTRRLTRVGQTSTETASRSAS